MFHYKRNAAILCLILLAPIAKAQQRHVDPRNMYERVLAVVPWTGGGSKADPKRPMYAPMPAQLQASAVSRNGILAFQCLPSDDGHFALCEFVARDRAAFSELLAAPNIKSFLKGRDKLTDVITEFSKHVKNFDINRLGVFVQ